MHNATIAWLPDIAIDIDDKIYNQESILCPHGDFMTTALYDIVDVKVSMRDIGLYRNIAKQDVILGMGCWIIYDYCTRLLFQYKYFFRALYRYSHQNDDKAVMRQCYLNGFQYL